MSFFEVTPDSLKNFSSRISGISKSQVPYATALMLTWTAQDVRSDEKKEMLRVFDRPTSFTLNSLYMTPATKRKLQSVVWFKDYIPKGTAAAAYLEPQVIGGVRTAKRYERAMRRAGILGANQVTVPGDGARLNAAGNISRGQITRMMSNVGAHHDKYQNTGKRERRRNRTIAAARNFFVRTDDSGMPIAIYIRRGKRKAKPFLVFTSKADYHRRFDFFSVAERSRNKHIDKNWKRAWKKAAATAKG